jgi:hypothetical protein
LATTVQGLALIGLLVIPGFLHYTVAKATRVWESEEQFEITVIFTSFTLTSLLVAFEVLAGGLLAYVWTPFNDRLHELLRVGLADYARSHPGEMLVTGSAIYLFNAVVMGISGLFDPLGNLLEKLMGRSRATQKSAWYLAFRPEEVEKARSDSSAAESADMAYVYLPGEGHAMYRGWSGNFDLDCGKDGDRYFQLWNAQRWNGKSWENTRYSESLSSVLLKASQVSVIEFTYEDVPHNIKAARSSDTSDFDETS